MGDVTICNSLTPLLLFRDCLNCLKSENIRSSVDQFYVDSLPISKGGHPRVNIVACNMLHATMLHCGY